MNETLASRPNQVAAAIDVIQAWLDRRQRAMIGEVHGCGYSPAQLHVLGLLKENGPTTVSQLAARLGTSPPSASAVIDRMVDADLVMRERSEEDRRVVTISIAPSGLLALRHAIGGRREMLERVLAQLSDEELRDTLRVLARLDEAISEVAAARAAFS